MKKIIIFTTLIITIQLSALDLTHWTQFAANLFSTDAENDVQIITGATVDEDDITCR